MGCGVALDPKLIYNRSIRFGKRCLSAGTFTSSSVRRMSCSSTTTWSSEEAVAIRPREQKLGIVAERNAPNRIDDGGSQHRATELGRALAFAAGTNVAAPNGGCISTLPR